MVFEKTYLIVCDKIRQNMKQNKWGVIAPIFESESSVVLFTEIMIFEFTPNKIVSKMYNFKNNKLIKMPLTTYNFVEIYDSELSGKSVEELYKSSMRNKGTTGPMYIFNNKYKAINFKMYCLIQIRKLFLKELLDREYLFDAYIQEDIDDYYKLFKNDHPELFF